MMEGVDRAEPGTKRQSGDASAAAGRHPRAAAVQSVVAGVVCEAVRVTRAGGIVILDDWTPEGELAYEWLVPALGEESVWRGAALASNVQDSVGRVDAQLLGAFRMARERGALIAHPASKTALLLGGTLPRADVFPLGDVYASQVLQLAGGWSVPAELEGVVGAAGIGSLDAALMRLVDGRMPADAAFQGLDRHIADTVLELYTRGRHFRLRPRVVPKLGARTLGVDLFD